MWPRSICGACLSLFLRPLLAVELLAAHSQQDATSRKKFAIAYDAQVLDLQDEASEKTNDSDTATMGTDGKVQGSARITQMRREVLPAAADVSSQRRVQTDSASKEPVWPPSGNSGYPSYSGGGRTAAFGSPNGYVHRPPPRAFTPIAHPYAGYSGSGPGAGYGPSSLDYARYASHGAGSAPSSQNADASNISSVSNTYRNPLFEAEEAAARFQQLEYRAEQKAGIPDTIFTSPTPEPAADVEVEQEETSLVYTAIAAGVILAAGFVFYSLHMQEEARKRLAQQQHAAAGVVSH